MATHFEKITHIEKCFQSALILGPPQRTLKNVSKRVKSVHQQYFDVDFYPTLKKYIQEVKLLAFCFHITDGKFKCN